MATAELPAVGTLTATDIKAIRHCDRLSVYSGRNGTALRAIKELKQSGPFEDREREYTIHCEARLDAYDYDGNADHELDGRACHELLYNYRHCANVVDTLGRVLRAGDVISLRWIASSNGYVKDAGLCWDHVELHVKRGDSILCFHLADSVCRNNTARMIKFAS